MQNFQLQQLLAKKSSNLLDINIIYYDKSIITNEDTHEFVLKLKDITKGIFMAIDSIESLKRFVFLITEKYIIENKNKEFIILIGDSDVEDIIYEFDEIPFITSFIILSQDKDIYNHLMKDFCKLSLIINSKEDLLKELKKYKFKNIEKDLYTPVLTFYEYDNNEMWGKLHSLLSLGFDKSFQEQVKITPMHFKEFLDMVENENLLSKKDFDNMKNLIEKITNIKTKLVLDKENALFKHVEEEDEKNMNSTEKTMKQFIELYTSENCFVYLLNKLLRENNLDKFSYYVSKMMSFFNPFVYSLYQYAANHPDLHIYEDLVLYRKLELNIYDIYNYKYLTGDIIIFPAFTSTTFLNEFAENYKISNYCSKVLKKNENNDTIYDVLMIIKYEHRIDDYSPCFNIMEQSDYKNEGEMIFTPFSFFKIINVEKCKEEKYIINLECIHKKDILEPEIKLGKKKIIYNKELNLLEVKEK